MRRTAAALRNAFASPGARLFGLRFSRDYLRIALRAASRWGDQRPGTLQLLGLTIDYPNQSYALFLVHEIFVNGAYVFRRGPRPRIIDCGANIGMSVAFFKSYAPDASIVAVEPEPATAAYLRRMLAANRLADVEIVQAAIAADEGTVTLYGREGDAGGIETSTDPRWGGSAAQTVPARRLSSLIDGPIDFLKLDVEGAEYDAIHDLETTDRLRSVREMAIECHELAGRPDARAVLVDRLERSGMRVTTTSDARANRTSLVHAIRVGRP